MHNQWSEASTWSYNGHLNEDKNKSVLINMWSLIFSRSPNSLTEVVFIDAIPMESSETEKSKRWLNLFPFRFEESKNQWIKEIITFQIKYVSLWDVIHSF